MATEDNSTNNTISWIALFLSIIALIFALVAFNKSGTDSKALNTEETQTGVQNTDMDEVDNDIDRMEAETEQAVETAEQIAARAALEARLVALKAKIAANQVDDATVKEAADIRTELSAIYATSSEKVQQQITLMDTELAKLETEMRQDTAAALATIENLLEQIRRDVITDDEQEPAMTQ